MTAQSPVEWPEGAIESAGDFHQSPATGRGREIMVASPEKPHRHWQLGSGVLKNAPLFVNSRSQLQLLRRRVSEQAASKDHAWSLSYRKMSSKVPNKGLL
jgi:hypothetical protein